ncbi:MAG TPA: hypothetical protein VEC36_01880 [Patescibacteria group bacterium]|nr:hypothetical protein [Patescibacteria group bacterium]
MNDQQVPGQDPNAVPSKTTVNVYEQPGTTTPQASSSGVNIQTIAIIAAVVIAVIMLINMIS